MKLAPNGSGKDRSFPDMERTIPEISPSPGPTIALATRRSKTSRHKGYLKMFIFHHQLHYARNFSFLLSKQRKGVVSIANSAFG